MEDLFHWHRSWIRRESGNLWHTVSMEEAPHVKKAAEKVGGRGQQTLVRLGQNLFSSWSMALYLLEDSLDATMSPTVSSRLKVIPTTFVFHVLQVPPGHPDRKSKSGIPKCDSRTIHVICRFSCSGQCVDTARPKPVMAARHTDHA